MQFVIMGVVFIAILKDFLFTICEHKLDCFIILNKVLLLEGFELLNVNVKILGCPDRSCSRRTRCEAEGSCEPKII